MVTLIPILGPLYEVGRTIIAKDYLTLRRICLWPHRVAVMDDSRGFQPTAPVTRSPACRGATQERAL
jgi:hypothetical protein